MPPYILLVYIGTSAKGWYIRIWYEANNWCIICHKIKITSPSESNVLSIIAVYTGRQPSYKGNWNWTAIKSCPTSFRSILTHYFLYKYIILSHIFISLLSSVFSSTLLIACTISVAPVRWLSSSVIQHISSTLEIDMALPVRLTSWHFSPCNWQVLMDQYQPKSQVKLTSAGHLGP